MLDHIILHIGTHKSGSTAIQQACRSLSSELEEHGICYPTGRHGIFSSFFSDGDPGIFFNKALGRTDRAVNQIADAAFMEAIWREVDEKKASVCLISWEGFVGLPELAVQRMGEYFASKAKRVSVIAYCRHPLAFAASELSQRARSGVTCEITHESPPIPAFLNYFPKYVNAFGKENVILRNFDRRHLVGGDVRKDFFAVAKFPVELAENLPEKIPEISKSLCYEAYLIAQAIRELHNPAPPMDHYRRYQPFLSSLKGAPIRLSDEEREFIMEISAPHLEYLVQEFQLTLDSPASEPESQDEIQPFGDQFLSTLAAAVKRLIDDTPDILQFTSQSLALAPRKRAA